MSDDVITVENVTKTFRIPLDHSTTLKYRATHPRSTARYRTLKVLDDVSLGIQAGEFLGITGPNGCGKSTLLKILSRIYVPDRGRVSVAGTISPFLELGVGFNPELTARENIFLGGAVLGLTRRELEHRVDDILEFAELTDFADQKIKNFSSGMAVRLAFTVAIQADADILLMDEVLAVGDARFQEKCFDVFASYKRDGRTIVLVSHDLGSLERYCDRALLLQQGKITAEGPAVEVTARYRRIVGAMSDTPSEGEHTTGALTFARRSGTRDIEITGVRLSNDEGVQHQAFAVGDPMNVSIDYVVNNRVDEFAVGIVVKRSDGVPFVVANTAYDRVRINATRPGMRATLTYRVPALSLLASSYFIDAILYDEHLLPTYDHIEEAIGFRVVDDRGRYGLIDLQGAWTETAPSALSDRAAAGPAGVAGG